MHKDERDADPEVPGFGPDRCRMYLEGNEGAPPREQLVRAITAHWIPDTRTPCALDLGCGPGREVVFLLERGFHVRAVDPYREMLERTRSAAASVSGAQSRLELIQATLEECATGLAREAFDLVHAGFVLPFVLPAEFSRSFASLEQSIRPGGLFVGQFFGPSDEFIRDAVPGTMSSHAPEDLQPLLRGFEVLEHDEVCREGRIGRGRAKWWHVHHVIARRRSGLACLSQS